MKKNPIRKGKVWRKTGKKEKVNWVYQVSKDLRYYKVKKSPRIYHHAYHVPRRGRLRDPFFIGMISGLRA